MRENRLVSKAAWGLALLFGQASLLYGLMVALGWTLGFALIVTPHRVAWMHGARLSLPIEPPLIGLAIGAVGLILAHWSREPVARYSVAGMVFNALSLGLALLSIAVATAR
jgi:hypothetical protein